MIFKMSSKVSFVSALRPFTYFSRSTPDVYDLDEGFGRLSDYMPDTRSDYNANKIPRTIVKKFKGTSVGEVRHFRTSDCSVVEYSPSVCDQAVDYSYDEFGLPVFADGADGGSNTQINVGPEVRGLVYNVCRDVCGCTHDPTHTINVQRLGDFDFKIVEDSLVATFGEDGYVRIDNYKAMLRPPSCDMHNASLEKPDAEACRCSHSPVVPEEAEFYDFRVDASEIDEWILDCDFGTSPADLVKYCFGIRESFSSFETDNVMEYISAKQVRQDNEGRIHCIIADPICVSIRGNDGRKLVDLIASFSFPFLKKHELPSSLDEAIVLYLGGYLRGAMSCVYLLSLIKYVDVPKTLDNLHVRLQAKNATLLYKGKCYMEIDAARSRLIALAIVLSSVKGSLAAPAMSIEQKPDWCSYLMQGIIIALLWCSMSKGAVKSKTDPLKVAFDMAKTAFFDPENQMHSNTFDLDELRAEADAARARLQARFIRTVGSQIRELHALRESYGDNPLFNGKSFDAASPSETMVRMLVDTPAIYNIMAGSLTDELMDMLEDIVFHTCCGLTFYFAGRTKESFTIRSLIAMAWLSKCGRKMFRRGLMIPYLSDGSWKSNSFDSQSFDVGELLSIYKDVKSSSLFKSAKHFFVKMIGLSSFATYTGIDLEDEALKKFLDDAMSGESLLESLASLIVKTLEVTHAVRSGVSLRDAITMGAWDDTEYVELYKLMESLSPDDPYPGDPQAILHRIQTFQDKCAKNLQKSKNASAKVVANVRMELCTKWKNKWRSLLHSGAPKAQPFVITFYGSAGIGKTTWVRNTMEMCHNVYNLTHEPIVPCIGQQDAADKYDSNLFSGTTAIIIDDAGLTEPGINKNVDPVGVTLQRYVGALTSPYIKSESKEKGAELNMAKFVCITTNHKCAHANYGMTDANAGIRRLGVMIRANLKPEYSTSDGKPRPDLFPDPEGGLGKHCYYTHYDIREGKEIDLTGPMESDKALQYLRCLLLKHFDEQQRRSEYTCKLCDLCKLPVTNGCCCVESNLGEGSDIFPTIRLLRIYAFMYNVCFMHVFAKWCLPDCENEKFSRKFGRFGVYVAWLTEFLSWFSLMLFSRSERVRAFNARVADLTPVVHMVGKAAGAVAVSLALRKLWRSRKLIIPHMHMMVSNLLDTDMSGLSVEEKKDLLKQDKVWAPVIRTPLEKLREYNMPLDHLHRKCLKATVKVRYLNGEAATSMSYGVFLATSFLLLPAHAWKPKDTKLDVEISYRNPGQPYKRSTTTIFRDQTFFVHQKDLCICYVPNFLGSRYPLNRHLPLSEVGKGHVVHAMIGIDDDCSELVHSYVPYAGIQEFTKAKAVVAFQYYASSRKGDCGLPVLYGDDKLSFVAGFHIAYSPVGSMCAASMLLKSEWDAACEFFLKNPTVLSTTYKSEIHFPPGFEKPVGDTVHPKNPVNYIPYELCEEIEVLGDIGKDSSARTQTKYHPLAKLYAKKLVLPDLHPVNVRKVSALRDVIGFTVNNTVRCDYNLVAKAQAAVQETLFDVVKAIKDIKEKDEYFESFNTVEGPYTISEVVNGKEGNPVRHGIKTTTSAGFPYNKSKGKMLSGEHPNRELHESVLEGIEIMRKRLESGCHSGVLCKMCPKDEPRPSEKINNPRIFQAVNLDFHVEVSRQLGPFMDACAVFPELAHCAIGVSSMSKSWEDTVGRVLCGPGGILEYDVSKFDNTIPNEIRIAAAKTIVLAVCELREDYREQKYLEHLVFDFISPMCSVNGVIVELCGLWPSGIPPTALMGAVMGRMLAAYSYYKRGHRDFNKHVVSQGLGDDFIGRTTVTEWDQFKIAEDFASIGMKITSGNKDEITEKFVDPHKAVFLRRVTRFSPELQCLVGQLDSDSIFRPLTTYLRSPAVSLWEQTADQASAVTLECLMHGEESYEAIRRIIIDTMTHAKYPLSDLLKMDYATRMSHHFGEYHVRDGCHTCVVKSRGFPDTHCGDGVLKKILLTSNVGDISNDPSRDMGGSKNPVAPNGDINNDPPRDPGMTIKQPLPGDKMPVSTNDTMTVDTSEIGNTCSTVPVSADVSELACDLGLTREVRFPPLQINVNDMTIFKIRVFDMLDDTYVKGRLTNVYSINFEVVVRFMLAASAGHYGQLLISWCPMGDRLEFQDLVKYDSRIVACILSSRDHVILTPESCMAELTIPWFLPVPSITPYNTKAPDLSPYIIVMALSPIRHVMDLTTPLTLNTYARFKDLKYSGATAMVNTATM